MRRGRHGDDSSWVTFTADELDTLRQALQSLADDLFDPRAYHSARMLDDLVKCVPMRGS